MPKVPPGILIGLATSVLGTAAAFGLPITEDQSIALLALVTSLSVAIPAFEAWLRGNRLKYLAARDAAQPQTINVTGTPDAPVSLEVHP